ncbi:hypothetical protein [Streptomyces monashensis]|nr:hypothetical protein [Streptomyces monashensis]
MREGELQAARLAADAGFTVPGEAAQSWLSHLGREPFLATVTFYVVVTEA